MSKKKRSSAGRVIVYLMAVLLLMACIGFSVYLYLTVKNWQIIPDKYMQYALYALIGVNVFLALFALPPNISTLNKILSSVLSGLVAAALIIASVVLPEYKGKFEKTFTEVPTTGQLNIDMYVLKNSSTTDIQQLAGQKVAVQKDIDTENQDYAVKVVNREISGDDIVTVSYDDIYSAVDALYSGQAAALLLSESYAEIVADNTDYTDFFDKVTTVYTATKSIQLSYDTTAVTNVTTQPFIMLVAGRDTYNYNGIKASANGRSDVVMLLVVNPVNKQILVVTIPRDSYVGLRGKASSKDKITHASIYGIDCLVQTVNSFLDVNINYFLRINFSSVIDVVDALGGITVDNPSYFCMTYSSGAANFCYEKGVINLDGKEALGYVRERHYKGLSDFARNQHQAIVIKAMIDKVTSVDMITKFGDLLTSLEGKFVTDMGVNDIYALAQMQLNDMADWDLVSYGLTGKTGTAHSYAMGRDLSVVLINSDSVQTAKDMIQAVMSSEGYHAQ